MKKYLPGWMCNTAYAKAARKALDDAYPRKLNKHGLGPYGATRYDFWGCYDGCFFE